VLSGLTQTWQVFFVFLTITIVYVVSYRFFRIGNQLAMLLGALAGGILSGFGPVDLCRHIVEGSFTFLNIVLIIFTATVFIYVQRASGGLDALVRDVIIHFHRKPRVLVVLMMFLVMLPPAFTGPGADGIFAFGALVSPVLFRMGVPRVKIAAFVALGGTLGVFAPPVNIPAMIIAAGINMPYVGFIMPLMIVTLPVAVFSALFLCARHVSGPVDAAAILASLPSVRNNMKGIKVYLPLIVVIGLMLSARAFPHHFPHLGVPLMFVIGTVVALLAGGKVNFLQVSREAFTDTFTINSILLVVGSLVQILSLTGVRGLFVLTAITVPSTMLYLAIFLFFPLFAGILTSFGACSVFGVPFMLALLGRDPIIATVGLSLVSVVGNLIPPTAALGRPAAIVSEYKESYMNILKACATPLLLMLLLGTGLVMFADVLRFLRF
jgi:gluconate:H+ symporter, GntP family